tara:strand:+ start:346 stop:501 length:156 start_codon:yes stop_codon:yes gene_type:complete
MENMDKWEEVPTEDLWEDGEIDFKSVALKLYDQVCILGKWKIIRRNNEKLN